MAAGLSGPPRRPRRRAARGLIGPVTGRQIAAALAVVVVAAAVLALLTSPVGPGPTPLPSPGATFVPVAPPTQGLAVGQVAPELSGELASEDLRPQVALAAGSAALVLGVIGMRLRSRSSRAGLLLLSAVPLVFLVAAPFLATAPPPPRPIQLVDLDGRPIRMADLRGRPVWINFFATWCPPCQEETPTLQRVYERHRDEGLVLVAISVQESTPEDVRAYASRYGLSYTIGFDATASVFKAWRAYGLPTQLFIDRDGVIRQTWQGPLNDAQAEAFLARILDGG
ncbi:MAG TPA: TlpA disulfide reductase family protein [Candidatus Limnocylindrales bacterium]|nr:TlpA disulfide reductase family protein [Candidatus Limnocylindrales bacterium]